MGTGQETDDFLQFAAHVLQENTSANDVLARVSDQGFAMLRLVPASGGADDWIQPLLGRLRNYAPEHGKPYNISVTAAIYPLQPTDTDPKEILSNANQIAHMAARDGHDYVLCTERKNCCRPTLTGRFRNTNFVFTFSFMLMPSRTMWWVARRYPAGSIRGAVF